MIFLLIAVTFFIANRITRKLVVRFYHRIKHGDQEHQDWLKKEFENYWDIKIK